MQITGKYDNHKIIDNASLLTFQYFFHLLPNSSKFSNSKRTEAYRVLHFMHFNLLTVLLFVKLSTYDVF